MKVTQQQLNKDIFEQSSLIQEVLSQDPRPAYHQNSQPDKTYGMALYDLNIQWQVIKQQNVVLTIV